MASKTRGAVPANGLVAPPGHTVATAAVRRLHQICFARSCAVVGKRGLTPLQYGVMVYLSEKSGSPGIEQSVLADRLNIDRNTASAVVEQMVKLGVVSREVNGAHRRARLLALTAKGEKVYDELLPKFRAANSEILAPLSPAEKTQFMNLLTRVIESNLPRQIQ
jgi:MarR family transcriptional regulator, lower aerobic nicotinate degradation pathway regulator